MKNGSTGCLLVALLALAPIGPARGVTPETSYTQMAQALEEGDLRTLDSVLEAGADINFAPEGKRSLLATAIYAGDHAAAEKLIAHGADVHRQEGFYQGTAIMFAADADDIVMVDLLLEHGADANHVSAEHGLALTPLHLAAIGGSTEVVEALVARGAQLDAKGTIGTTPLLWGLFEGSTEAGIRLVELGADPTIPTTSGYTALDFATDTGNQALLEAIEAWKAR